MKYSAALSLAASLRWGSVSSFHLPAPLTIASTKKAGAELHAAVAKQKSSTSSSLRALFRTDDPEAELEEIKTKYAKLTESLEDAKKRQEEARESARLVRERLSGVEAETEVVISRLKRDLSEEMSDLSDKIEGAQDDLRKTMSRTKSEISNIRGEARTREQRLNSEISDLEDRLSALREDAKNAAKERDSAKKSIRQDERDAEAATRKEIKEAKREAFKEKKKLTRDSWDLETRIQQARLDLAPAKKELEESERQDASLPSISSLKDALMEMKRKMMPQVDELKEKRAASEMFFDQSLKKVKREKKSELDAAKSAYEGEISTEDVRLANATSDFELQLEKMEKELQRNAELATKPVESFGDDAVSAAAKNRIALYQDKVESVESMRKSRDDALKKVVESHTAMQDQYDAEYENEVRNFEEQGARGTRRLKQEDKRREKRRGQLKSEMEELTRKLSQMMQDERTAADKDFQSLKMEKSTELASIISRSNGTLSEIQTMKSNLKLVEYELRTLELESQKRQETLAELEEERGSFRKQARRTVALAFGRITRRGSR